jgi:hypothetical protein
LINKTVLLIVALLIFSCGKKEKDNYVKQLKLPPVVIEASVDKVQATTMDTILYSIDISSVPGLKVNIPEVGENIIGFRIIDLGEEKPRQIDDRIKLNKWYKLQADIIGSYIIPSVKVSYEDANGSEEKLETSEIFVQVKSAIGENEEFKDIIDIKPLIDVKVGYPRTALILIISSIVLICAAALIIYLRKKKRKEFAKPLLAHEIAFKELDELKNSNLLNDKKVKIFYFMLQEIVRRYIESRFLFNASEWTTEEILPVVKKDLGFEAVLIELIESFLKNTDLVKFTDFIPRKNNIQLEVSMAYKFVEQTIKKEKEQEDEVEEDSSKNGLIREAAV